jgi:hypothetical protein
MNLLAQLSEFFLLLLRQESNLIRVRQIRSRFRFELTADRGLRFFLSPRPFAHIFPNEKTDLSPIRGREVPSRHHELQSSKSPEAESL